jgi:hypothetical protein
MKKITLLGYLTMALILFLISCDQQAENEILELVQDQDIDAIDKADNLEVDKLENDGLTLDLLTNKTASSGTPILTPAEIAEISCGDSKIIPLLAGRSDKLIGNVTVSNNGETLYITYNTEGNWIIKSTHLYIGPDDEIPSYNSGYPKLWRFPYHAFPGYYRSLVQNYTFAIPISNIDLECTTIVANAIVKNKKTYRYKSAFAYEIATDEIHSNYEHYYYGNYYCNQRNWNKTIDYCKQTCDEYIKSFAYSTGKPERSFCFLDEGFSYWGWTNGKIFGVHTLQLYANVDGCDWSTGEYVGYVRINYNSLDNKGKIQFITADTDYSLKETYLYIGAEKYPTNNLGEEIIDPEKYPYIHKNLEGNITMDEYDIEIDNHFIDNIPEGGFYVIAYATVSKQKNM